MKTLLTVVTAALLLASTNADAKIIHEERSLYRNILISEQNGERCMRFVVHDRATHNQSCFYLANPRKLVFDYAKMVMASLLVKPEPNEILIVGLGGGTLPAIFHELLPNATITSAEIDPAVVKAAKRFFHYQESAQVQTVVMDARVYLKRALRDGKKWDLIILDAFNGDYIPEHLMTKEFLQEVRSALNPGGLVVANTFATSRLYHHESVTYEAVFPHVKMLASPRGNRVLLAAPDAFSLPGPDLASQEWQARLAPYGIDVKQILALEKAANWDKSAKVLTDQFAPANLLKH
ncbi:MAG: spermidine synthase [Pseudomonadota bacterium]